MLDMVSVCFCWVVPSTLVMSNFMGLKFSRILRDLKLAVFHITLCRVYIEHRGEDIHVNHGCVGLVFYVGKAGQESSDQEWPKYGISKVYVLYLTELKDSVRISCCRSSAALFWNGELKN